MKKQKEWNEFPAAFPLRITPLLLFRNHLGASRFRLRGWVFHGMHYDHFANIEEMHGSQRTVLFYCRVHGVPVDLIRKNQVLPQINLALC